jgi:hypothetical protein
VMKRKRNSKAIVLHERVMRNRKINASWTGYSGNMVRVSCATSEASAGEHVLLLAWVSNVLFTKATYYDSTSRGFI